MDIRTVPYHATDPCLGDIRISPLEGRSYCGTTPGSLTQDSNYNYVIRAEVEQYRPFEGPVGGLVMPVNEITVLAPYLARISALSNSSLLYDLPELVLFLNRELLYEVSLRDKSFRGFLLTAQLAGALT